MSYIKLQSGDMIKRRQTTNFKIGSVKIGSNASIIIQSMTKVPTVDINSCVKQIKALQVAQAKARLENMKGQKGMLEQANES